MNVKEQRRKKDRERYAKMADEKKQERLKKRREAYKKNKAIIDTKKYADLTPEQMSKKCAQKRQKYANLQQDQKRARLLQIKTNRELRRKTPCKESIAMVNPAYIESEEEDSTPTFNVYEEMM